MAVAAMHWNAAVLGAVQTGKQPGSAPKSCSHVPSARQEGCVVGTVLPKVQVSLRRQVTLQPKRVSGQWPAWLARAGS